MTTITKVAAAKVTPMQEAVLRSFPGYDNPLNTKSDLGSSWTGVKELATASGLTVKQVQGVLSGLSKRGFVYADEEGGNGEVIQCLTEEGCDVLAQLIEATPVEVEIQTTDTLHDQIVDVKWIPASNAKVEQLSADPVAPVAQNFAAMFEALGGNEKGKMYKVQKAVAAAWTGTREDFVVQSIAYGIIRRTTVINWKEGREGK